VSLQQMLLKQEALSVNTWKREKTEEEKEDNNWIRNSSKRISVRISRRRICKIINEERNRMSLCSRWLQAGYRKVDTVRKNFYFFQTDTAGHSAFCPMETWTTHHSFQSPSDHMFQSFQPPSDHMSHSNRLFRYLLPHERSLHSSWLVLPVISVAVPAPFYWQKSLDIQLRVKVSLCPSGDVNVHREHVRANLCSKNMHSVERFALKYLIRTYICGKHVAKKKTHTTLSWEATNKEIYY
jgi:hypothetical protein